MATEQYHVATVQILMRADDPIEMIDGLAEFLREGEQDGRIADWGYLKVGGQQLSPTEVLIDPDTYEEGDFLR